jgi:pimeloyl-ACP methyl ester carboxylesterase
MTAQGADGTPLHVVESGRADAPVTVVLAHGWTLDERCWAPVAESVAAAMSGWSVTTTAGTAAPAPSTPRR